MADNPFTNRIIGYGTKPADQFQANPANWRKHPQRQRDAVQASLSELGWIAAVVENVRTGHLVDGHERVWQALGKNEDVPYLQVDLSEAEERLALAIFDPITYMAETDAAQLDALLQEVNTTDAALQALLAEMAADAGLYPDKPVGDTEPQTDRAEELRQVWGVSSGQMWALGEHRLICGDCTDAAVVARVMGGERASLLVTSPPYNQQLQSQSKPTGMHKENKWFHRLEGAYSDAMPEDEYQGWQVKILDLWFEFVRDGGACFYNHKHRYRDRRPIVPLDWIRRTQWQLRQEIVWDRRGGVAANAGMFIPGDERIYWLEKDGEHVWNGIGNNRTTVWAIQPQVNDGTHVCPFPLELASLPIQCVSNAGDVICDPVLGSGTTIIACENLGRKCRAVEISPAYVAVALQRWADHTGKTPELTG